MGKKIGRLSIRLRNAARKAEYEGRIKDADIMVEASLVVAAVERREKTEKEEKARINERILLDRATRDFLR